MYPVESVWEVSVLGQDWLPCGGYHGCVLGYALSRLIRVAMILSSERL
jgi:hypothetical protein